MTGKERVTARNTHRGDSDRRTTSSGLHRFLLSTAFGMLAATPAGTAFAAQEAEDERETKALEEIVVTATRQFRPTDSTAASKIRLELVETPQALTVLSSDFLEIAHLKNTVDVVSYAAGIEHAGTGDGTQARLVARGFPIDRTRSFRVNGLSVDSELDFDYFTMSRVEVVRGPASSLYGEADYGATLNRVLKAPSSEFGYSVSAAAGSDSYKRLEGDIQGALNDSGTITGRAVAVIQDRNGFIRDTEQNHWAIAPSIAFDMGDTELLLQGYYADIGGRSSDGFPLLYNIVDAAPVWYLPDLPLDGNYGADFNTIDSNNAFVYADLSHDFSDSLTGSLKAAFSRVRMDNLSTYLFSTTGDGNAGLYASFEDKDKDNLSIEASLQKSFEAFGQEQTVLVSSDWRRDSRSQPYWDFSAITFIDFLAQQGPYDVPLPSPVYSPTDFTDDEVDYFGVTALAHLRPTERLSLLLGLRYSGIDSHVLVNRPSAGLVSDTTGDDSALIPRAAIVYNLAGSHHAFLSYTEGLIFNETSLGADGSPIDPEQGVQYETGLKGELFDDRVFYSLSAFMIERSDVATVIDLTPGSPTVYGNIGEQHHKGIEMEMNGEILPGLNLLASYAYLDVEVKDSVRPAEEGQRPGAAPRHSLSAFATYEVLSGSLEGLTIGGGVVYRSEREVDNVGSFELPAYTRIDLRAAYQLTESTMLELNIQNLLDEEIYTSQYNSPALGIAYSQPFQAIASISYRR